MYIHIYIYIYIYIYYIVYTSESGSMNYVQIFKGQPLMCFLGAGILLVQKNSARSCSSA